MTHCEHGRFRGECPICNLTQEEDDKLYVLGVDGGEDDFQATDGPSSPQIVMQGVFDHDTGQEYYVACDGVTVQLAVWSESTMHMPAEQFWALVEVLEREGMRPGGHA